MRALEREAKAQRDLFESYLAKYREATARDSIAAAPRRRPHHLARGGVEHAVFPEEDADRADRGARDVFARHRIRRSRRAAQRRSLPADAAAGRHRYRSPPPCRRRSPSARTPASDRLPARDQSCRRQPPERPSRPDAVATGLSVDEIARGVATGRRGRPRIAVIGSARNVGTTLTAIALARALASRARVVLVDLALGSPNVDVISDRPARAWHRRSGARYGLVRRHHHPGPLLAGCMWSRPARSAATPNTLIKSPMLAAAVGALAQSYDYLVIDAGCQSEIVACGDCGDGAPCACWSAATRPGDALERVAGDLRIGGLRRCRSLDRSAAGARSGGCCNRGGMTTAGDVDRIQVPGLSRSVLKRSISAARMWLLRPLLGGVGAILTLHHVRPARPDRFQPNRLLEVTPEVLRTA